MTQWKNRKKDFVGQKLGRLTVLASTEERRGGKIVYDCLCDCSERFKGTAPDFGRKYPSCGCWFREVGGDMRKSNGRRSRKHFYSPGDRFGLLTLIEPVVGGIGKGKRKEAGWKTRCDCGRFKEVREQALITGATVSCGCARVRKFYEYKGQKMSAAQLAGLAGVDRALMNSRLQKYTPEEAVEMTSVDHKKNWVTLSAVLPGQTFGDWEVIGLSEKSQRIGGASLWDCRCKCGTVSSVVLRNLVDGLSQRCGTCGHRDRVKIFVDLNGRQVALTRLAKEKGVPSATAIAWKRSYGVDEAVRKILAASSN